MDEGERVGRERKRGRGERNDEGKRRGRTELHMVN